MLKVGKMYRSVNTGSLAVRIKAIMSKHTSGAYYKVDWYTEDAMTKKLTVYSSDQEYYCSRDMESGWKQIE